MFHRKILDELKQWMQLPNRKPLIIRGARQVGKTTAVFELSKEFDQFINLNLELIEDKRIFENAASFEKLLDAIFFLKGAVRNVEKTLLFIDEIQNSGQAVKMLRYFFERNTGLYVIAAGSLLETLLEKNVSFPVGRVEFLILRPFSFEEFLLAAGEDQLVKALEEIPCPGYAFEKIFDSYRIFTLIGGMPEVVKTFIETRDLQAVKKVITNLIISFKEDVEKYGKNRAQINTIQHVIDNSFSMAGQRIKFQGFGNSNYRSREIGEAFRTLEKTMLLKVIYPTTNTRLPILANKKKSPKLQILDTGMMNFALGIERDVFKSSDLRDVYKGAIIEHLVGQELLSLESNPDYNLHFWVRDKKQSSAEVDFLYPYEGRIIPIEVKSGSTGKLKSLHQFINLSGQKVAIRFYSGKTEISKISIPGSSTFTLINLPYFLTTRIKEYINHYWVE